MADYTFTHDGAEIDQVHAGAFITVANITERDAIDTGIKNAGFLVRVESEGVVYMWNGSTYELSLISNTITEAINTKRDSKYTPRKIYVSALNGSDLNDGSYSAPVKSLSRLKAIVEQGDEIFLERGSIWQTDVETSSGRVIQSATQTLVEDGNTCLDVDDTLASCSVYSYGYGDKPLIDGSVVVPSSAVSLDSGNLYTFIVQGKFEYQLFPFGGATGLDACHPFVIVDGINLTRVADKATANATKGSFFVEESIAGEFTYYVHGFNSEDMTNIDMRTAFKSYYLNTKSSRTSFSRIDSVTFARASQKDAGFFGGGVLRRVSCEQNPLHHGLWSDDAIIEEHLNLSDSDTVNEGFEAYTFGYSSAVKIRNLSCSTDRAAPIGMFSHSSTGGGFGEVVINGFNHSEMVNVVKASDVKDLYMRGVRASNIASYILTQLIEINNFNGVGAPSRGKTLIADCNVRRVKDVGFLRERFLAKINIPRDMYFKNVITNLSKFAAEAGSVFTTVDINGTVLNFEDSTVIINDLPQFYDGSAVTSPAAQNLTIKLKNSAFVRPVINDEMNFGSTSTYEIIDEADLANGGVLDIHTEGSCLLEKVFIKKGGVYLSTLADLQAAFPGQISSDTLYGTEYIAVYTDTYTVKDLAGTEGSWSEDPSNSLNWLLEFEAPHSDIAFLSNSGGIWAGTPEFMFRWVNSAVNRDLALRIDAAGAWITRQSNSSGSVFTDSTFESGYVMMRDGKIKLSIPKTEILDSDTCSFSYNTFDIAGYGRTVFNGNGYGDTDYALPVSGAVVDKSIGYNPNRITQDPKFSF